MEHVKDKKPIGIMLYELRRLILALESKWDYLEDYEKQDIYDYVTKMEKKVREL